LSEPPAPGVFCIGLAVQDTILTLPALPTAPGKVRASARREVGGGPAATAAVAVARLGAPARFAGLLGADATGDAIVAELAAEGVDTAGLLRLADWPSPASVVLVDAAGERLIVVHAAPLAEETALPALDVDLDGMGAILCDCFWPAGAKRLIAASARRGLPSVLDADVNRHDRATIAPLVAEASHVVFSRGGLAQFASTDDIADGLAAAAAARSGPARLLGVTDGADGLYIWTGGGVVRSRPPRVTALDTTGAGDAFHGALALGLANGWEEERAIALAHAVAALKCTRPGGRAGLPDRAALTAFAPDLLPLLTPRSRSAAHGPHTA
jgi:sulfofructose kinase